MQNEKPGSQSIRLSEDDIKRTLLELSGWQAWCCGFANRMPDGSIVKTTANFHLDHVIPKSKGGSPLITNRAPLCPTHNTRKGSKWLALHDLRLEIAERGELLVDKVEDLIDLGWAYDKSLETYVDARIRMYTRPVNPLMTQSEWGALAVKPEGLTPIAG